MKRLLLTMFVASAVLCTFQSQALAQGCGGYGGGAFWGLNQLQLNPYHPSDRQIPYFAAHPPVYYSYPVPRTYGYSPYASPPTYTAPEVRIDPVIITNPYIQQAPAEPAKADKTEASNQAERSAAAERTPGPLMVINPFVSQNSKLARLP